jgi:hypothetical protein
MIIRSRASGREMPLRRRDIPTSNFDNWYIHCPKCQGLLVLRLGPKGPEWLCLCGKRELESREERE